MDRSQVIAKIQSILKLQNGTEFEGEASAAAKMIDKLCKQYGVTVTEASVTQVMDEEFLTFKKSNYAYKMILNAIAIFYDAKAYISNSGDLKSLQIIGSEAQQIQVRLYFDYLIQVMEKECELAHKAEKVMSSLTQSPVARSFKLNFRKAFADNIAIRLLEMKKEEGRTHEDAKVVQDKVSTLKLSRAPKMKGANGEGAFAGAGCGSSVSLNRQASGSSQRALSGS
jgi:hypothetical protein